MKNIFFLFVLTVLVSTSSSFYSELNGQSSVNRDTIILAAHEIINETTYCGLITVDSLGLPKIRTMNAFPVEDDFVIWFATSRTSRKVREIRSNPNVCVYFANHLTVKGYVNINGSASVIDNKDLLIQMKRDYWNSIQGWQDKFVLIKIIPKSIEIINYKHGLSNDPNTFKVPTISF
ncbi:MAG: pyridoxamine 5'-phosphate oxidase family protein [Bacteroidales bacterium]|jgi:general stress protein 26|nr:pyridoxamine 5'-phosphate oxidase family protein [Bacteroidales bacterium]